MNKVENGILNNIESYLKRVNCCTDVNSAKTIVTEMINACKLSDAHKMKLLNGLNTKRDLTSIMMFAYNINLKGEGLGTK